MAREKKIGSITIKKNPNFPSGTHLQGYIKTNRAELRKVFGNPNMGESGDGKSKGKEWNLIVGGKRVTIYDYREKDKKGTKYFNIGGDDKYGALLVAQALSLHRNEKVHAIEISPAWSKEKFGYARGMKFPDSHDILTYERAKEYEDNRRGYRAETFDVEFNDWANQEMMTHGKDISFKDWAEDEGMKHGNVPITEWAQHEEESHDARYGAEEETEGARCMRRLDEMIDSMQEYADEYLARHPVDGYLPSDDHHDYTDVADGMVKDTTDAQQMAAEIVLRAMDLRDMADDLDSSIEYDAEEEEMWEDEDYYNIEGEDYWDRIEGMYEDFCEDWEDNPDNDGQECPSMDEWVDTYGNFDAEEWNWGGDPEGQLATALRKARIKLKKPRKPLKIEKLDAEEGGFFQLEVKYKMEDGWEHHSDYDNEEDATGAYYDIYLKYPEVVLLEVDSEGDGDVLYRQRNYDVQSAETSGQWEIGEQLEEAQMNAETEMERYNKHMDEILEVKARLLQENEDGEMYIDDPDQEAENDAIYEVLSKYYPEEYDAETFEGIPQSVSGLEAVEDVRCDKYELEVNFENEDMVIVSGEELKAIMDDGWDLDSVRSFEGAGMSLLFTRNPNRAFRAEDKEPMGLTITREYERYLDSLPHTKVNKKDRMFHKDSPMTYSEFQDAYLAKMKKRKKISGLLSDPFDELSLDSGGMKSVVVGIGIGLLACFGYSKWK